LLRQLIASSPEKAALLLADRAVAALELYRKSVHKEIVQYPCEEHELFRCCLSDAIDSLAEPYRSERQEIRTYSFRDFNEITESIIECLDATIIERRVIIE